MEWEHITQSMGMQMVEKPQTLAFLGRRSFVPRPLSEATEIFDTDNEDDSTEDGSAPRSMDSLDDDSQTTISTPDEARTPDSGGLGGFDFHFDEKPITKGPSGPHLFRSSSEGPVATGLSYDLELPLTVEPAEDSESPVQPVLPVAPRRQKTQHRPFSSLNRAVAELDESQVRNWTPQEVANWMRDAGFESSVVEKFLTHDISGVVLLDLQFEDLKELDITSYGKRHRVMSSIQHLRNSSMISRSVSPSKFGGQPEPSLQRVPSRGTSQRRGRLHQRPDHDDVISPAESVSIVAIEQLLPKPHKCSKGEDCAKWQKQQRKIKRLREEFCIESTVLEEPKVESPVRPEDARRPKSDAEPSVVASSDVLGPGELPAFNITPEKLNEIAPRDPQENVRQFLSFQHLHTASPANGPSPPPANSASFVLPPSRKPQLALTDHLRNLPKLTIPVGTPEQLGPYTPVTSHPQTPSTVRRRTKTPVSAIRHNSQTQLHAQQLQADPYHYGGVASPADLYRVDTPFSATDIPVTSFAPDPLARDVSQSVPPEMRYGAPAAPISATTVTTIAASPIARPSSAHPVTRSRSHHRRQNSFTPTVAPLPEAESLKSPDQSTPLHSHPFSAACTTTLPTRVSHLKSPGIPRPEPPLHPLKLSDIAHSGPMRKRRTTPLLRRHEWSTHHFTLRGTRLAMHPLAAASNPNLADKPVEVIDVDEYAVACASLASSSKLSAAFKRSVLGAGKEPQPESTWAFSLVPSSVAGEGRKVFAAGGKSHHFAVGSRDERIDWMRELMLAKALKRGRDSGNEIRVNGHLI